VPMLLLRRLSIDLWGWILHFEGAVSHFTGMGLLKRAGAPEVHRPGERQYSIVFSRR